MPAIDRIEAIERDLTRKRHRANILCRDEEVHKVARSILLSRHSGLYGLPHPFSPGWSIFRLRSNGG